MPILRVTTTTRHLHLINMNKKSIQIFKNYARQHETAMFQLLRALIDINSHTPNIDGVNQVNDILCHRFTQDGIPFSRIKTETAGDIVLAGNCSQATKKKDILLCGHTDTVFPPDSAFVHYSEDQIKAYGPGVIDMKGGLVVAYYAWKALVETGLGQHIPIRFLLIPYEETGSMASRDLIRQAAEDSICALVYECAGPEGETVVGRKGKLSFKLNCHGRAGHAAFVIKDKPSAILDFAEKTRKLEKLNNVDKGISVNVGWVQGGIGPNTVADNAQALIDCRFLTQADGKRLHKRIERICQKPNVPGTHCDLQLLSERPPMEATEENRLLFNAFFETAQLLDVPFREETRNGVSDANLISAAGTPVLDGLGPIGGDDHSDREWMLKESLTERVVLSAMTILNSWELLRLTRAA